MYVFSLVLCLWDAPTRSGKSNKMLSFLFFFYSILPSFCCCFFISVYSRNFLAASVRLYPVGW